MSWQPQPIDTSHIELPPDLRELVEALAENVHDNWAGRRIADGWHLGPSRSDRHKEHPCLVPYEQLPDSEKQYDRTTAAETLKAILALGYEIRRP